MPTILCVGRIIRHATIADLTIRVAPTVEMMTLDSVPVPDHASAVVAMLATTKAQP